MPEIETVNPEAPALPEAESAGVAAQSEGTSEGAQAAADAVDPVKAAQEPKKVSFKRKDGTPVEFDSEDALFAALDERETLKTKRKEYDRAASQKFEHAAKVERQMEALRQSDPEEFFKLIGRDPMQFAIERLQREVALKEATPEQRRIMELESERQRLIEEKQAFTQQQEEAQQATLRDQFVAKLDKELPPAVQKHGLPTDPLVFRAVAGVIADQIRSGIPEDAEAAAEIVADTYRATFKQHAATLKYEDALKQYPEFVKLVREGDLARAKSGPAAPARPAAPAVAPKKPAAPAPDGGKKFNDYFDDWAGLVVQQPG
jgi:hypothetical protein